MFNLRQKAVEDYINKNCVDFPFPEGVKSLFSEEELKNIANQADLARDVLKAINKSKAPLMDRITPEQVDEYYYALMVYSYGEIIVDRLKTKIDNMKYDSYEKSQMKLFLEKMEDKLESGEIEKVKNKLSSMLNKPTRR